MILLDGVINYLIEKKDDITLRWVLQKMDNKANISSINTIGNDIIFSDLKNKTELMKLLISGSGATNKELREIKEDADEAGLTDLSLFIVSYSGINEHSNFILKVNRILK
jgi:hypothetical protein